MQFFIKGEFLDETVTGKGVEEALSFLEQVAHRSLNMLDRAVEEGKITGGAIAGVRKTVFILNASSNEETGSFLRSLPFWRALRWTVIPLQSFKSAVEQDKAMFVEARQMAALTPRTH